MIVVARLTCVVPGCPNLIVRVCVKEQEGKVVSAFGLCAHHVRRAILHLKPEQIDRLVFPEQR